MREDGRASLESKYKKLSVVSRPLSVVLITSVVCFTFGCQLAPRETTDN
jgi:hypothetical protein